MLFLTWAPSVVLAQTGLSVRGMMVNPMNDAPFLLGGTLTWEGGFSVALGDENRWQGRGTIGIIYFDIRFPEIPSYAIASSSVGEFTVFPGVLRQESFGVMHVSIGVDYNVILTERFRAYVGIDGSGGVYQSVFESDIPSVSSGNRDVSNPVYGGRIRAGMAVHFWDRIEVFTESNYARFNYSGIGWFGFADVGLGIRYLWDQ
ncbi:MAG: hypothetical protein ABR572_12025 [Cryomorphaceae bacterium]